MAYQHTNIAAGTVASSNKTGTSHEIETHLSGANILNVQFNGTSLSAADGVFTLEQSNDNVNYTTITDSSVTMASGSSSQNLVLENVAAKYIRSVWAKGANASGTIAVYFNFK